MTAPRPLTCAEAFLHLDDYVDRELGPADLAAVEAHLGQCRDCTDEFDTEQQLLGLIRAKLARIRLPDDLRARIAARLRE